MNSHFGNFMTITNHYYTDTRLHAERVFRNIYLLYLRYNKWAASSEEVSLNMCKKRRFRLSYTCPKYHPGFCSVLIHSVVSSEGPDQTAQMGRLIWVFAGSICPKTRFHMVWPICPGWAILLSTHNIQCSPVLCLYSVFNMN